MPVALGVAAAAMLGVLVRILEDCSPVASEAREVASGALLLGSGAAVALAIAFPVLGRFGSPALASAAGVAASAAFGAAFFLYAVETDLGDCPS